MKEAQYLQSLMNSEFLVYEVTKGWYIHELDGFEIGARQDLPYIQEPLMEWFFRDNEPHVKEVELTSNVLYAQKFSDVTKKSYQDALRANFLDGHFIRIKANTTIEFVE